MTLKNRVEAALFAAGRPLTVHEIRESLDESPDEVRMTLKQLAAEYEAREGALAILKTGERWSMQLSGDYSNDQALAPTDIPLEVLKTAALIAYHQPIRQAELREMIGDMVYSHVRSLKEKDLISARPSGRTLLLETTRRFPEYFGIDATSQTGLREWMSENAGMDR